MTICPECGAESTPEMNCETVFNDCLAHEFVDPDFGEIHHLTIAAYMLQHSSRLSDLGWLATRQLLREFLIEKKSPSQIKKQNKNIVDSGKRNWKIRSSDGLAFIDRRVWTKTILDINLYNSAYYRDTIIAWASTVLTDSETISLSTHEGSSEYGTGTQHEFS